LRKPGNVIVRPDAVSVHSVMERSRTVTALWAAAICTDIDSPVASFIWEATVRIHTSSYSRR